MPFLGTFLIALIAGLITTPFVQRFALRRRVVHEPGGRRQHGAITPLLGGAAILFALLGAMLLAVWFGWLPGEHIKLKYVIGIALAGALLVLGGSLDDIYELKPKYQAIWPVLAALVIVASGIGVPFVTNPLGGQLYLNSLSFDVLTWGGIPYRVSLIADLFTIAWLLGMTYTTKFLDGLDGLVSGITVIGGLIIAAVSLMKEVSQPDTAILALAVSGAYLGFLRYNINPARIFLGEGGSTLAGFLLGVLAIISGGKIATTLLVVGLPLFDAAVVILRRVIKEKRSPFSGDRSHLHFKLLERGISPRQAVFFYWFVAAFFGVATLVLRGWEKIAAIAVLLCVAVAALAFGQAKSVGKKS